MKEIKNLEEWAFIEKQLTEGTYHIWQMQHDYYDPEGFHVWFWVSGKPEIEFVTHDRRVQATIVNY